MHEQENSGGYGDRDSSRWLWLAGLTTLGLMSLSIGKLLLAAGMLLLGVFAWFNNPLQPTLSHMDRPAPALALSWACGLAGMAMIVAAAARTWL